MTPTGTFTQRAALMHALKSGSPSSAGFLKQFGCRAIYGAGSLFRATGGKMDHAQSIKEVFRHVLFRLGAERLLNRVRRLRGREIGHLQPRVIADSFSYIYSNKLWVESEDQTSLSGSGSTASATGDLISQLSDFLKQHQCKRLLDVGCGDFNWMQGVPGDFDYVGIDIVPEVIASNNEKFGNARRKFICANAAESSLNFGADVVICREVLFHLSFATCFGICKIRVQNTFF